MAGLIEEIQRDALNKGVPADALLRKVKLAAAKLQLKSLETWVEQELNGYKGQVPHYRETTGQPAGWNPYNGWIPIYSPDEKFMETISKVPVRDSVATLEDLIDNNSGRSIHYSLPPGSVALLNEFLDSPTPRIVIQFGRGAIISILDSVRNMVLDWAIEMEKKGVLGDGLSFDRHEKTQAKQAMNTFNIGSIGNFVGNLGTGNTSGDVIASVEDINNVRDVIKQIKSAKGEIVRNGVDDKELSSKIEQIEDALSVPRPEKGRLRALL